ncbi:MAG TPA: PepSY domain-containing protein [Allosphingosinicella sp.]|nr:PepSY domain-containing protein [Allosphingosinicella sp.]
MIARLTAAAAFCAAALTLSVPASATGKMTCDAPQAKWKSIPALEARLKKQGWQVRKSKVDGGCYEVYGTDPKGNRVEAYFHPVTLEKLLVSRRGEVLFRKK